MGLVSFARYQPRVTFLAWDESKHPRVPKGDSEGGQFTSGVGEPEIQENEYSTDALFKLPDGAGHMSIRLKASAELYEDEDFRAPTGYAAIGVVQVKVKGRGDGFKLYKAAFEYARANGFHGLASHIDFRTEDGNKMWESLKKHGATVEKRGNWTILKSLGPPKARSAAEWDQSGRFAAYNPNQKRAPKGTSIGGQWVDEDPGPLPGGQLGPHKGYPFTDQTWSGTDEIDNDPGIKKANAVFRDIVDVHDDAAYRHPNPDKTEAARLKAEVVKRIGPILDAKHDAKDLHDVASLYGVPHLYDSTMTPGEKVVDGLLHKWAQTSGDSDLWAALVQYAIAEEFDLDEAATKHLLGRKAIENRWTKDGIGTVMDITTDLNATEPRDKVKFTRRPLDRARVDAVLRSAVRAQYEDTQRVLKSAGVESLTLVRGVGLRTEDLQSIGREGIAALQPASSFTASAFVANSFAFGEAKGKRLPAILRVKVPRSRVFSLPKTGFGCLAESEVLLLGGKIRTRVLSRGSGTGAFVGLAYNPDQPRAPKGDPEGGQWVSTGAQLGPLYHGGKRKIAEVDPSKLQSRDHGFYGEGFYVTSVRDYAKAYGNKISEFKLDPNATVLMASLRPEDAPAGLVDEVFEDTKTQAWDRAVARGKTQALLDELELIRTDPLSWKQAVSAYAKRKDFAVVHFSAGEIVVRHHGKLRGAAYNPDQPRAPKGDPEGGQWVPAAKAGVDFPYADDAILSGTEFDKDAAKELRESHALYTKIHRAPGHLQGDEDRVARKFKHGVSSVIGPQLDAEFEADQLEQLSMLLGTDTAGRSGGYSVSQAYVDLWAATSGDHNPMAVLYQHAVAEELGVEAETGHLFDGESLESVRDKVLGELGVDETGIDFVYQTMRAHARAQYGETQAQLKKAGAPEMLTLARGMSIDPEDAATIARTGRVALQPLSSFTSDLDTASIFAKGSWGDEEPDFDADPYDTPAPKYDLSRGHILRTRIPRSRIFSIPRTGFGCLNEYEFVVLGNRSTPVKIGKRFGRFNTKTPPKDLAPSNQGDPAFVPFQGRSAEWNEADHPRAPAGGPDGGQFVDRNKASRGRGIGPAAANDWDYGLTEIAFETSKDSLYRGISQEELDFIERTGEVKSNESYCVPGEGTCFDVSFSSAESYVNYGRSNPGRTGKSNYVIEIGRNEGTKVDPRDGYHKAPSIPADRIKRIWEFHPDGRVTLKKDNTRRSAEYNPDQPRDPAGTSTGGQWTDGDSEYLEPIGPQSKEYPFEEAKSFLQSDAGELYVNREDALARADGTPIRDKSGEELLTAQQDKVKDEFDEALGMADGPGAAGRYKRGVEQLIGVHLEQQFTREELDGMAMLLGIKLPAGPEGMYIHPDVPTTRIAQSVADRITHQWAVSSGDTSAWSVLMQDAIRQEFDLDDAVMDHMAEGEGVKRAWGQLLLQPGDDEYEPSRTQQRSLITRVLRAHARAQYTETQIALERAGIDHVDLVRGMAMGGSTPDESREPAFEIARTGVATLQPASSFSLSFNTARDFSFASTAVHITPVVIRTRVPRRRILSFPKTGFGCLSESEVVVLGGKIKTRIMYWLQ